MLSGRPASSNRTAQPAIPDIESEDMTVARSCWTVAIRLAAVWCLAAFVTLEHASAARAGEAADSTSLYQPATDEAGQQVQRVVLAQLKAFVPETAPFAASVPQGKTLEATVGGERYQGVAYRPFSFMGTGPDALTVRRFYVKTTAAWKLPDGTEIPATLGTVRHEALAHPRTTKIEQDESRPRWPRYTRARCPRHARGFSEQFVMSLWLTRKR